MLGEKLGLSNTFSTSLLYTTHCAAIVPIADCAHVPQHFMTYPVAIADYIHVYNHKNRNYHIQNMVDIVDCTHLRSATAPLQDIVTVAQENSTNRQLQPHLALVIVSKEW